MDPIVTIEIKWVKEPPTGEFCIVCKEHIFSNTNVLYIVVNDKFIKACSVVCDSCFELLKDNNGLR